MSEFKRVLVVTGSEPFLRMLRFYFGRAGYEVASAVGGAEALRLLTESRPDAVIADSVLPDMEGLTFLRQLRTSPVTLRLPVLMVVTGDTEDGAETALDAGATDIVDRQAPVQEIGDRLAGILGATGAREPVAAPLAEHRGAHTVTVIGARGGSGKTLLATNLGVAFAQRRGETTVVLDLNLEFGTAAMMLDLRPLHTLKDIADAAMSNATDSEFDSMLLRHSSGLRLVPSVAQPGDSERIPEGSLPRIIERLRQLYDHVVVDGRPSFREVMLDLWERTDTLLVTCPPEVISVLVTRSLLEAFQVVDIDPAKILVVMNQVAPKARLTAAQVERGLNHPIFPVPYGGEALYRSVDVGKIFLLERPNDPTAQAISRLAATLVDRHRARASGLAPARESRMPLLPVADGGPDAGH